MIPYFCQKSAIKKKHYIQELISQGEHLKLDFKYGVNDSKKIARSLVAFANAEGGTLLIGVKDNGKIAGIISDEEFYMIEAAAELYSKPPVPFVTKTWKIEGKHILEVIVPQSIKKPHYAPYKEGKYRAYIRIKDENVLANKVLTKTWIKENSKDGLFFSHNEQGRILLKHLEDHEKISLSRFMKIAHLKKSEAEDTLSTYLSLKLLKIVVENKVFYYALDKDSDAFQQDMINGNQKL